MMATVGSKEESSGSATRSRRGRITWDEEVIADHDKDRGTRMKIDEPETPYMYPELEDATETDEVKPAPTTLAGNWDEISAKLKQAAEKQKALGPDARLEWVAAMEDQEEKARAFADKRRQHYNEFEKLQKWREAQQDNDDDDEPPSIS